MVKLTSFRAPAEILPSKYEFCQEITVFLSLEDASEERYLIGCHEHGLDHAALSEFFFTRFYIVYPEGNTEDDVVDGYGYELTWQIENVLSAEGEPRVTAIFRADDPHVLAFRQQHSDNCFFLE